MARKRKEESGKWWKRPPRSSRICARPRCGHKYSSHIDVRCLKIVQRNPRIECDCKGFIKDEAELKLIQEREKNMLLKDKGDI